MTTGLLVGRFQPFHNGHLYAVKQAFEHVSHLIIGIGSSQYSHDRENPFTAEERKEMIDLCMNDEGIKDYTVVNIPDIHSWDMWVEHVNSLTPEFDIVFTGNDLTEELFSKKNIEVFKLKLSEVSSTDIRDKIRAGQEWESLVPAAVVEYLKSIEGGQRVKEFTEKGPDAQAE